MQYFQPLTSKELESIPLNDNNYAFGYYRYSSESQNDASIDVQREACRAKAKELGYEIIREFPDPAISGTLLDRPEFQKMLQDIAILKPRIVFVYDISRLGRDEYVLPYAKQIIRSNGCQLTPVHGYVNDGSSAAYLATSVEELMAVHWSKITREKVRVGVQRNAKQCLSNGHFVTGFTSDKKTKEIIIEERGAMIVRRIFAEYLDGRRCKDIADDLNAEGLFNRLGHPWKTATISKTLRNPQYKGTYKSGEIVVEHGQPSIVSDDVWEQAQLRLDSHKQRRNRTDANQDDTPAPRYWLSGKLFCGECGSNMIGKFGTGKYQRYYYYSCHNRVNKLGCDKEHVRKESIENAVIFALQTILSNNDNWAELMFYVWENYLKHHRDDTQLKALQADLKNSQKELDNIITAIKQGRILDALLDEAERLELRIKGIKDGIEKEEFRMSLAKDRDETNRYFEQFRHLDPENEEARDILLNLFIDKIFVYDDHLVLKGIFLEDEMTITAENLDDLSWENIDWFNDLELSSSPRVSLAPPTDTQSNTTAKIGFFATAFVLYLPIAI